MSEAVRTLSLMYYFTGIDKYASKASTLLRTWFIDEETRMHPHLEYGQFIPGHSTGRSVGIIESRNFVFLTDYEKLLLPSGYWTSEDQVKLKRWMTDFMHWLLTSEIGLKEKAHTNNHGSWYDYQVLALSQYCDRPEIGKSIVSDFYAVRLEEQIEANGQQPEELTRTKSFNYSTFNLDALTKIALLSENYGSKYEHTARSDAAIKNAIDYLIPYTLGEATWEYPQISNMDGSREKMIYLIHYAHVKWGESRYSDALAQLTAEFPQSRHLLTIKALSLNGTHTSDQR